MISHPPRQLSMLRLSVYRTNVETEPFFYIYIILLFIVPETIREAFIFVGLDWKIVRLNEAGESVFSLCRHREGMLR